MSRWPVVPICARQQRDCRAEDLVTWADTPVLFRLCDVYRGGGGYDKFPAIAKRYGGALLRDSFAIDLVRYLALEDEDGYGSAHGHS